MGDMMRKPPGRGMGARPPMGGGMGARPPMGGGAGPGTQALESQR